MKGIAGFVLLPLYLAGCSASDGSHRLVMLGNSLEPVRSEFNANRGRPRVVALFSPT